MSSVNPDWAGHYETVLALCLVHGFECLHQPNNWQFVQSNL